MLTVKPFKSTGAAIKYYSHGDYYGSEGVGVWLGKGAMELGLKGQFDAKNDQMFFNLVNGRLPNGQVLGRKTSQGIEHRPGVDLTFSCPKSFSIQMLLYADKEQRKAMEKALMNAVEKTLSYLEEHGYVITRKGQGGKEKEKAKELIFASFLHTTNRNVEPQAHVHCFLANVAKCSDGKFRSISYDKILDNVKLIGQAFRNELALEVKKLGYQTHTKILSDGSSSFELSHIHSKLIDAFSTRRKEIVALCKKYGVTTKEGRDKIVINSRKAKKSVDWETLQTAWKALESKVLKEIQEEEKLTGKTEPQSGKAELRFSRQIATNDKLLNSVNAQPDTALNARDLALLCIEDASYYKTVFTEEELVEKMLKFSIGSFSTKEVHKEILELEKAGFIISSDKGITTKELLDKERQIFKYAKESLGQANQIIKEKHFENRCKSFERRERAKNPEFKINDQQKKALKHILTSKDNIVAVEGLPGVGKSTVLNAVRDISNKKIINLIGFGEKFHGIAPTASAAKTLKEAAKIESRTMHSFLGKYQGYIEDRGTKESLAALRQQFKKVLIFLDESSLVSTQMMWKLLKLRHKLGFRLVTTGDTKQQGSREAGKPFEQMLEVIPSVKLDKIVRQKDDLHKEAVVASSKGDILRTFAIHDSNIQSSPSKDKGVGMLIQHAVSLYLAKDVKQRDETLLISPTRKVRDGINESIREALSADNTLKGDVHKFPILKQKDFSNADYQFAPAFTTGDVLKFNKSYKNGIEKRDYLEVIKTHEITNSLTLKKDGKEYLYQLKRGVEHKFEVFEKDDLKLQEGLKIKFTKNNKEFGLINSETAIIQKIDQDKITLKIEDGTIKEVAKKQLRHIDYGYCMTIFVAQGKTFMNTIAAIATNKWLNHQKSWLVTLSRHKSEFTAFVQNKNKLKAYLMNNKGDEISAIEFVSNIPLKQSKENILQAPSGKSSMIIEK